MKKKLPAIVVPIVPDEIRKLAKQSVESDKLRRAKSCGVCGSPYVPNNGPQPLEDLCWVCKRLKISAWRDSDQQISVQE
jgi:hypothetical protein